MQKWNDTQEGVKFPIKWNQSYEGEHRFFDFDRVLSRGAVTATLDRKDQVRFVMQTTQLDHASGSGGVFCKTEVTDCCSCAQDLFQQLGRRKSHR